ncbi:MAG: hypothetical protein IPJ37_02935 [Bacteroidales bacterium]|nr:hypothetical protein [Bacteroidales bacterium]
MHQLRLIITVDQVVVASGGQVTINSGFAITLNNGAGTDMDVNGTVLTNSTSSSGGFNTGGNTLAVNNGGILQYNVDGDVIPTTTWNTGSTCLVTGITSTACTGLTQTFYNLTWNCPAQTVAVPMNTNASQTINGNFDIQATNSGSLIYYANDSGGGSRTLTVSGNFVLSGGTFNMSSASSRPVNLNIAGDFLMSGGTFTEAGSGINTVVFNKAGTQIYSKSGGSFSAVPINFIVNSGSTLDLGTSVIDGSTGAFTLSSGAAIVTANTAPVGALTSSGANGSIQVTGARSYNAGASYTFNASAQATGNGFTGAANLTINNGNGVTLTSGASVSGTLTLTNGILTTSISNVLSITNTATNAIANASDTRYINGPLRWTLPSGLGTGSSYVFPIGNGTAYLPFSLVNPTTGSGVVTALAEAFTGSTGGTAGGTLASISTSEYWSLLTAGNFLNSSVSLTRQSSISPLNVIGGSSTLGGSYETLSGTPSTNGVSNSNSIGANRYFVLAEEAIPTITLSSPSQVLAGTQPVGQINAILSVFQANVPAVAVTLNSLDFTSAGTYVDTDIANFKLYFNTSNTFAGSTLLSTLTTSLSAGAQSFTGLTQVINSGTTGYFWITSDISVSAVRKHY